MKKFIVYTTTPIIRPDQNGLPAHIETNELVIEAEKVHMDGDFLIFQIHGLTKAKFYAGMIIGYEEK